MRRCPNRDCAHRLAVSVAAEFDDVSRQACSDCGAQLVDGPAPRPEEARPAAPPALRRRAWMTILAPLAVLLATWLAPVPGVHLDHAVVRGVLPERTPSILDLGITPFLVAAVLCELARRLWPSWRPRTAAARAVAPLGATATAIGGLAAAGMAWQFASMAVALHMSTLPAWTIALTVLAGSALTLALATLVTRLGLTSGLASMPACIVVAIVVDRAWRALAEDPPLRGHTLPLAAVAGAAVVTWWATSTSRRLRGELPAVAPADADPPSALRGQDVVVAARMPVVRLPLAAFPVLLLLLAFEQLRFLAFQLGATRTFEAGLGPPVMRWTTLGLMAVVALLADGVVLRPAQAAATWARAAGDDRAEVYEDWLRGLRKGASVRSLAWAAALVALSVVCDAGLWAPLVTAMATAAALDGHAEWRALRAEPTLTTIAHEDDVATADALLFALRRAGIEGHVRALRTRALLRFVGTFVPMALMVPRARVDEAELLVARVRGERGGRDVRGERLSKAT